MGWFEALWSPIQTFCGSESYRPAARVRQPVVDMFRACTPPKVWSYLKKKSFWFRFLGNLLQQVYNSFEPNIQKSIWWRLTCPFQFFGAQNRNRGPLHHSPPHCTEPDRGSAGLGSTGGPPDLPDSPTAQEQVTLNDTK